MFPLKNLARKGLKEQAAAWVMLTLYKFVYAALV